MSNQKFFKNIWTGVEIIYHQLNTTTTKVENRQINTATILKPTKLTKLKTKEPKNNNSQTNNFTIDNQ